MQFGDLRVPKRNGLHPVAIVIHGGCWVSAYADLQLTARLSDALTNVGIATWNIEFRPVDKPGGGWPRTLLVQDRSYEAAARKSGDDVQLILMKNAAYFEMIAPGTLTWKTVENAVISLLDQI